MKASRWFWAVPLVVAPLAGAISAACIGTAPDATKDTTTVTPRPDTGPADTGPADTEPADTGPADTGPADTGPADTGPKRCKATDPFDQGQVSESLSLYKSFRGGRRTSMGKLFAADNLPYIKAAGQPVQIAFDETVCPSGCLATKFWSLDGAETNAGVRVVFETGEDSGHSLKVGHLESPSLDRFKLIYDEIVVDAEDVSNLVYRDFRDPQQTAEGLYFSYGFQGNNRRQLAFAPALFATNPDAPTGPAVFYSPALMTANRVAPFKVPGGVVYFTETDLNGVVTNIRAFDPSSGPTAIETNVVVPLMAALPPNLTSPWKGYVAEVSEDECDVYFIARDTSKAFDGLYRAHRKPQ